MMTTWLLGRRRRGMDPSQLTTLPMVPVSNNAVLERTAELCDPSTDDGAQLLWLPYFFLTLILLTLCAISFAHFHHTNKERYSKRKTTQVLQRPYPVRRSTVVLNMGKPADQQPYGRMDLVLKAYPGLTSYPQRVECWNQEDVANPIYPGGSSLSNDNEDFHHSAQNNVRPTTSGGAQSRSPENRWVSVKRSKRMSLWRSVSVGSQRETRTNANFLSWLKPRTK